MKNKELYIPVNVPDRNELIPGFGVKEIVCCLVVLAIGIITAIIMCISGTGILWALGVAIVMLVLAITIFRKNQYGENLIDKTQYVIKFSKSQKKYQYKYHNIYEGEVKK